MRIAQVAPLFESVPPSAYGGTGRVVSWLTEELVRQGHDVTLFASGDSRTGGELVPRCKKALWHAPASADPLAQHVRQMEVVVARAADFDAIHFHADHLAFPHLEFPLLRRAGLPSLTTLHGALDPGDHQRLFEEYDELSLVSVSNAQRAAVPNANFVATVHYGMPLDLYRFHPRSGDYLAFVGRVAPQEGLDRAIEIAVRSGTKLKVGARIHPEERGYYDEVIAPLLRDAGPLVEFVGEVDARGKAELLGGARALLFPIGWEEPFSLVMLEALASGTPIVAFQRGSVPEVVDDDRTGFVVDSVDEALSVLPALGRIERRECRAAFERRFGVERMATEYVTAYRSLGERRSGPRMTAPLEERLRFGVR